MSGTRRDLLFWSRMRCFACKNHRWVLGPTGTCNSDARHTVLHAQNHRLCLGPTETCNSSPKVAVLHTHNDRLCLGLIETCYSGPKVAVLHPKTTHEVWDPQRLVILVLKSLFCMHKTTGKG